MAHEQQRAGIRLQRGLEQLERFDVEIVRRLVQHQQVRGPREKPREQQPVALAARQRPDRRVGPLRRKQEVAEIGEHVLAPAGGLDPLRARADRLGERALAVELLRATGRNRRSRACVPSLTVPESGGSAPRISFSSVDLPAPFAPIKPSRSPRMMRSVRSRTSARPPNALLTCVSSATSRPERSPASTASLTLPRRARRSLRSRRSDSSLRTRPSSRVRRASTPLRIQASSCAQNWSNLRLRRRLGCELARLARLVRGEVAGIRAQQAAVELDDARGHAVEERAVVRDHDRRPASSRDEVLDPRDAVDVEVIGRLVQQQQVGLERERQRQRRALSSRRPTRSRAWPPRRGRSDAGTRRAAPPCASARARRESRRAGRAAPGTRAATTRAAAPAPARPARPRGRRAS